jgi:hypothetical protein
MLATEQMKTLAYSPRYWDKYLELLSNPLARLVDLMVIKQGDKIAHQKGWSRPKRERPAKTKAKGGKGNERARRKRATPPSTQGSLFPDLPS